MKHDNLMVRSAKCYRKFCGFPLQDIRNAIASYAKSYRRFKVMRNPITLCEISFQMVCKGKWCLRGKGQASPACTVEQSKQGLSDMLYTYLPYLHCTLSVRRVSPEQTVKNQCKTCITKTCLYNFDPLKPNFYIVKLGFTEYTLFLLFLLKNIDCGYALEPPRRGGSNAYSQSMF